MELESGAPAGFGGGLPPIGGPPGFPNPSGGNNMNMPPMPPMPMGNYQNGPGHM